MPGCMYDDSVGDLWTFYSSFFFFFSMLLLYDTDLARLYVQYIIPFEWSFSIGGSRLVFSWSVAIALSLSRCE